MDSEELNFLNLGGIKTEKGSGLEFKGSGWLAGNGIIQNKWREAWR